MAFDMFIKIDGVDGESADAEHAGEIDVLAWSWGVSQAGTMHLGGGGGGGKASFQDISFTKYVDKSSPILMLKCANGAHIGEAVMTVRKAGETPLEYLKFTFTDILVSSVSMGGSGGEDRLTENVTINFRTVLEEYQEQAEAGGAEGGVVSAGWDIAGNTEL